MLFNTVLSFQIQHIFKFQPGFVSSSRRAWSWRAAVMCSCSQVELVAVVLEHQQTVEVPPPFQDSVLVAPPARRRVGEAVHRQGCPGSLAGPLQVAPAGQVEDASVLRTAGVRLQRRRADRICWMSLWTS